MLPRRTLQRALLLFSSASKAAYEAWASLFPQDSIYIKSKVYWVSVLQQLSVLLTPAQDRLDRCAVRCCLHVAGTWVRGSKCWAASQTLVFFCFFFSLAQKEALALKNELKQQWAVSLPLISSVLGNDFLYLLQMVLLHYFSIPGHYWTWLIVVKCYRKDSHQTECVLPVFSPMGKVNPTWNKRFHVNVVSKRAGMLFPAKSYWLYLFPWSVYFTRLKEVLVEQLRWLQNHTALDSSIILIISWLDVEI